ncbi:silicon efflux transporter LSI2-like isoform X2 [Curcuma longa]|uniref:silicon efflux transporter LSI2-like isoform X2 n=1 Tax=Curcuma longa TaxID=136217 RepID=UPI003D9E23B0
MAVAAVSKVVLGSVAFSVFWVLAVFPAVPVLPIGRTAGALLSAMLMVLFGVMTPEQAFNSIDLPILALLFSMMVVSAYLERADLFGHLGALLSWRSKGAKDLLFRVCLVAAFFTNDTACVVLTAFVLKLARRNNLPPRPFLLALASSANVGSAATPIGNPQNLVIASLSGITFGRFLLGLLPAMLLGVLINAAILLIFFFKQLSDNNDVDEANNNPASDAGDPLDEEDVISHRFSPATMSHLTSVDSEDLISTLAFFSRDSSLNETLRNRACSGAEDAATTTESTEPANSTPPQESAAAAVAVDVIEEAAARQGRRRRVRHMVKRFKKHYLWRTCVYLVTVGMLVALLMGLNMAWTALTAALALIVLDFTDAQPCLEKVSYSLLIFFCGMFITVDGFNRTGIPSAFWDFIEPHARVDKPGGIALLALVVIFLSNIASNVPTVLLLGAPVAASAARISSGAESKAWLILAWVSTVAGNLTLLGSAANLIVCEQAQRVKSNGYTLSFFAHLPFGCLSTLVVTAVGLLLIRE